MKYFLIRKHPFVKIHTLSIMLTELRSLERIINKAQKTQHSYTADNTLVHLSNTAPHLIRVLEEQTGVVLTWLKENQMIANLDKFNALIIKKDRTNTCGMNMNI